MAATVSEVIVDVLVKAGAKRCYGIVLLLCTGWECSGIYTTNIVRKGYRYG